MPTILAHERRFQQRWPPHQFPALYMPPADYLALRRRERLRRRLLELFGAELPALVEAEVQRVLAEELPDAVAYLVRTQTQGATRNGTQAIGR